jgi:hypothetical protein
MLQERQNTYKLLALPPKTGLQSYFVLHEDLIIIPLTPELTRIKEIHQSTSSHFKIA